MSFAHTHPELAIVCRILQQASIPIAHPSQFDQQWTPVYLKQCFQWTDHLTAMLNSTSQSAITDPAGSNLTEYDAGKEQLGAIAIVRSFLDTLQNDKHRDSSISTIINGKDDALGILPTLPELLDSSEALQKRLLNNPGLSQMAIIEIFRLNDLESDQSMPTSSSRGALTLVNENAIESLVQGVHSHFLKLESIGLPVAPLGDIEVAIDRKAKARVIFSKMCDPSCPLNPDDVICKLNEYLESSRSEAVEVIGYLSDMATSMIEHSLPSAGETRVDWKAFVQKLDQLS